MNGTQTNQTLFGALRKSTDPKVADAIETLVREGEDRSLCRINVLKLAAGNGLDEEKAISGFLHAARLGLFELSWNVLCPGCGGVLDTTQTLKSVRRDSYDCALCACGYEPTLDEMVEVTFTVESARCAASRRTIRTRCRSWSISGRYSGAPASICPRPTA